MSENGRIDRAAVAASADRLLREHPEAEVAAIESFSAFYCDMPASVPLNGQAVIRKGRLYDLVDRQCRVPVFDAWRRVRQNGAGTVGVTRHGGEPVTLYFLDTRETYGVLLAILVPGEPEQEVLDDLGQDAPARSRFGRFWRDDLGRIVKMDEAAEQLLGFSAEELHLSEPIPLIHPDFEELAYENWIETLGSPGVPRRWRCRHLCKDGSYLWVEITNTNHLEENQGYVLSEMMDVSDEMAANERVRESQELLLRLAESMPLGIVQADAAGGVVYTNSRLHDILGIGDAPTLAVLFGSAHFDDRMRFVTALDRVISSGVDFDLDLRIDRHDQDHGRICQLTLRALRDGEGGISGVVCTVEDITESSMLRRELERRANIDNLTGCHNRESTMSQLERLLQPGPGAQGTGVVFIDLDKFKPINDRLGHAAGDQVLVAAAERLRASVRAGDIVGRLGGDEFLIVCPDAADPDAVLAVARRAVVRMSEPLLLAGGESVELSASIGVAWSHHGDTTADGIVARADAAMYEAKGRSDGLPVLA